MIKRALATTAFAALLGMMTSAAWSQQDIRWGTPPVGTAGHKAMVAPGEPSQQGDAAIPHLGAADRRRHRHRQRLCHQGARRLLRVGHRLPRARQRLRPLQGLQGARAAHADPVVLVEHHRDRPRRPRAEQGQDQDMGRPQRQAHVHRAAAVRHARPDRARLGRARREVHLCAGRPGDGRIAARVRRARRHEHLHRLGKRAAAVAGRSLARRRLGRAQSKPGRIRRAEEKGPRHRRGKPRRSSTATPTPTR